MPASTLTALEQAKSSYGKGSAETKLSLLSRLERVTLRTARAVFRLHEILCFLRAYPDDERVLVRVERMLENFSRRRDLRRHRAALADTGIAGTAIYDRFFWSTVQWLARRWPSRLRLVRSDKEVAEKIRAALPLLVSPAEAAWLKETGVPAFEALDRLRARGETDLVFLARRVARMPGDSLTREAFFDALDPSCQLLPGPDTPSRTQAKYAAAPLAFQKEPLRRVRPDLRKEISIPPRAVGELPSSEGERLIELARCAMATRARDLDAFSYGDRRDVRVVDDGGGLSFMVNGVVPERRALIPANYGYLILRNGVPIGYGQLDFFGRLVAISFNIFETFRGAEAAWNFARLLAIARHVFGATSFSLDPYQLGKKNEEGIASGAWWFYTKLGFEPRAAEAQRILREELARMKADPDYRSSKATLLRLAKWHLFFDLDPLHPGGLPAIQELGPSIAESLAVRAGADRERALADCSREAMRLTGLRSLRGFNAEERRAWLRWSPLLLVLPGLSRWQADEKRALVRVVRAKAARRESDYVALVAAHPKLEQALSGIRSRPRRA